MTAFFNKIYLAIALLILGLCGWIWVQSQKIDSLYAKNQAQAQTIQSQSKVISQLKDEVEQNRQLTLEVTKQESELREKADEVIKYIPAKTKSSDAYNAVAPDNVIEFLREP
ncbi:DUF2570 family protein [Lonepinella sp. BR2930]|uniref:DUF2570 family protein n=1 Tax=Lonepinella sp. BR2930 TaxID=3434554 RepID=UPI003F6E28A2